MLGGWLVCLRAAGPCLAEDAVPAYDPEERTPDVEEPVRVAVRWGLNWLADQQRPEGSWSNEQHPAMTALPLLAFLRGEHERRAEVLHRGVAFLRSCVQEDGGIYRKSFLSGGLSTYNTALSARALAELRDPALTPIILDARRFLAEGQRTGQGRFGHGGFGYDTRSPYATADVRDTVEVLETLRMTEPLECQRAAEESMARADREAVVMFLTRAGSPATPPRTEGLRPVSAKGDPLWGLRVHVWLGLLLAGLEPDDPRVAALRDAVVGVAPALCGDRAVALADLWAMSRALAWEEEHTGALPREEAARWRRAIVDWLLACRRSDADRRHSWWVHDHSRRHWEGDPVVATSFAILTLQATLGW